MHRRIPTDEEYFSYDGAHCRNLWKQLGDHWLCPGCGCTKREIMRWTRRKPKPWKGLHEPYMGWMAGLHKHHDHAAPFLSGLGRFPDTVICDQCNSADGRMKRDLKLPADFSFSPQEIRRFVLPTPHGRHGVAHLKARAIYEKLVARGLVD
jgi:hypothetical protein